MVVCHCPAFLLHHLQTPLDLKTYSVTFILPPACNHSITLVSYITLLLPFSLALHPNKPLTVPFQRQASQAPSRSECTVGFSKEMYLWGLRSTWTPRATSEGLDVRTLV